MKDKEKECSIKITPHYIITLTVDHNSALRMMAVRLEMYREEWNE